ncbi:hypothetical protein DM02DRAFT_614570 [Periconia macrospinosa]|uniref:Heterokaryon incompatibility domain-containing protein n=1 Tax=Periconia macrospinosa TaxID=97972 RepID=A0A2V1DQK3_9PLEO|nr:hypothetical protein DM02DRAFT_614570 [Periconia macrospinosa]
MSIAYRPLKKQRKEIRLLDLDPASRLEDPLQGTLRHAKLHEAHYTALSYVWGQPVKDRSNIIITYSKSARQLFSSKSSSKYVHSIGSSLAAALRHLRQKYGRIVIWTDALCINQADNDEKSWQVPLMNDIYSTAKEVHAWLGPRFDDDAGLIRNMNAAFSLADTVWGLTKQIRQDQDSLPEKDWLEACFIVASAGESSNAAQRVWTVFSAELRRAALANPSVQKGLVAIKHLSQNDYFARMWILQETGRAVKLTFHYGSRHLSHRRILLALGLANSLRSSQENLQVVEQLQGFDSRFLGCLSARTTCAQKRSLRDVLAGAYFIPPPLHQATDIRDLIYARLGLAENPTGIDVDYKQSVAEVYNSTSRFLLLEGFLELLVTFKPYRFQQGKLSEEGLASWAYDWSKKGMNAFDKYTASRDTSQKVTIATHHDPKFKQVLTMTGVDIGKVQTTSERFSIVVAESGLHKGTVALGSLRAVSEPLSDEYKEILIQRIEYFYEELGVDVPRSDIESLFSYRTLPFGPFWCWWLEWVSSLIKLIEEIESSDLGRTPSHNVAELLFREAPDALQNSVNIRQYGTKAGLLTLVDYQRWSRLLLSQDEGLQNDSENSAVVQIAEALFRSAWGMRAVVLDTGRLGYVPEDAKEQDRVVICHGVKAPLVIRRKTADAYSIIGPAHVCGAMQGQLMNSRLASDVYKLI